MKKIKLDPDHVDALLSKARGPTSIEDMGKEDDWKTITHLGWMVKTGLLEIDSEEHRREAHEVAAYVDDTRWRRFLHLEKLKAAWENAESNKQNALREFKADTSLAKAPKVAAAFEL